MIFSREEVVDRIRKDSVMSEMYAGLSFEQDDEKQKKSESIRSAKERKFKSQGRGFKSKQKKIITVYKALINNFKDSGYMVEEVDRSPETTRVHAKTYDGLLCITDALQRIRHENDITIQQIGFHKSMKNKFQQKGILVYIKVENSWQVEKVFQIYNSYGGHLKDHAVAISKEEREKMKEQFKLESALVEKLIDAEEDINCKESKPIEESSVEEDIAHKVETETKEQGETPVDSDTPKLELNEAPVLLK